MRKRIHLRRPDDFFASLPCQGGVSIAYIESKFFVDLFDHWLYINVQVEILLTIFRGGLA